MRKTYRGLTVIPIGKPPWDFRDAAYYRYIVKRDTDLGYAWIIRWKGKWWWHEKYNMNNFAETASHLKGPYKTLGGLLFIMNVMEDPNEVDDGEDT